MSHPRARRVSLRAAALAIALTLALVSGSVLPAATSAQAVKPSVDGIKANLQAALDALKAGAKFPGMALGVVLADGTALGLVTGQSDIETGTPLKPSDRMLMGSVGKTYVAAVALQLVHERKIGLDDKIEKWLGTEPWFPRLPNGGETTIRHLMTHTSGLVRYEFQEKFTADLTRQPDKAWKPEELVSYILDLTPPFAPGYAGPQNPFGGTDAMIRDGRFAINPQFEWTGGGLACTAADLARWAKALYEGRAFDPSLLALMLEAVPAKLGPEAKYGLGVIVRPTPLGLGYGHSGYFPGYLTEMMYFPDFKTAVAVQVNTSVPRNVGKSLVRVLLELAAIAVGRPAAK